MQASVWLAIGSMKTRAAICAPAACARADWRSACHVMADGQRVPCGVGVEDPGDPHPRRRSRDMRELDARDLWKQMNGRGPANGHQVAPRRHDANAIVVPRAFEHPHVAVVREAASPSDSRHARSS